MDIRITDHGNIWVDGKQYIGLDRMNQLLQERGAIDYDRIQSIVAEAVKTPGITEEQVVEYCKSRNWAIYDNALLDERLASQYRLGYNEGAKDADDQFEKYCKTRNLCVVGAETLSQRYDEGYKAGSKDANARFNILDVQRHKDLEELRAAHANLKIEFVKRLYEGLDAWANEHKIGYTADDFVLVKTGIAAVEEVIRSQLTLNEYRRVFDLPEVPSTEAQGDKYTGDGCGFVD